MRCPSGAAPLILSSRALGRRAQPRAVQTLFPPDDPENRAPAVASQGKIGPSRRITNKDMPALSETALVPHQHDETSDRRRRECRRRMRNAAEREAAAFELRQAFCAQLKAARERRGISLHTISERTKVSEGLFADLERGKSRAGRPDYSIDEPSSGSTRRSSGCPANRRSVSSFVCFPRSSKPPRPRCSCPDRFA